jgi:hypothetical protein
LSFPGRPPGRILHAIGIGVAAGTSNISSNAGTSTPLGGSTTNISSSTGTSTLVGGLSNSNLRRTSDALPTLCFVLGRCIFVGVTQALQPVTHERIVGLGDEPVEEAVN